MADFLHHPAQIALDFFTLPSYLVYKRILGGLPYEIRHYISRSGHDPFQTWLEHLRDRRAKLQILRRLNRAELGNFGGHRFCRDGVWGFRVDVGPGYRVYYALYGNSIILLLCGGDKRTQDVEIDRGAGFWRDWQERPDS